jgi:precorrin-6B methylase 1
MLMSELPRAVVEKLKALDFAAVRAAVGEYLSDEEIRAVLVRRELILEEIDRLIQVNGEAKVLY